MEVFLVEFKKVNWLELHVAVLMSLFQCQCEKQIKDLRFCIDLIEIKGWLYQFEIIYFFYISHGQR